MMKGESNRYVTFTTTILNVARAPIRCSPKKDLLVMTIDTPCCVKPLYFYSLEDLFLFHLDFCSFFYTLTAITRKIS